MRSTKHIGCHIAAWFILITTVTCRVDLSVATRNRALESSYGATYWVGTSPFYHYILWDDCVLFFFRAIETAECLNRHVSYDRTSSISLSQGRSYILLDWQPAPISEADQAPSYHAKMWWFRRTSKGENSQCARVNCPIGPWVAPFETTFSLAPWSGVGSWNVPRATCRQVRCPIRYLLSDTSQLKGDTDSVITYHMPQSSWAWYLVRSLPRGACYTHAGDCKPLLVDILCFWEIMR